MQEKFYVLAGFGSVGALSVAGMLVPLLTKRAHMSSSSNFGMFIATIENAKVQRICMGAAFIAAMGLLGAALYVYQNRKKPPVRHSTAQPPQLDTETHTESTAGEQSSMGGEDPQNDNQSTLSVVIPNGDTVVDDQKAGQEISDSKNQSTFPYSPPASTSSTLSQGAGDEDNRNELGKMVDQSTVLVDDITPDEGIVVDDQKAGQEISDSEDRSTSPNSPPASTGATVARGEVVNSLTHVACVLFLDSLVGIGRELF